MKCVFEVDPLKCPKCGGTMKIVSFIGKCQDEVIRKVLKHCNLWKEPRERLPPDVVLPPADAPTGITYDTESYNALAG